MNKGVSEKSAKILLHSITSSTMKQYEGYLKGWIKFAAEKNIDIFSFKNTDLIEYLTFKFNEKDISYSTLNSIRSAVSLISKNDYSKDPLLNKFFRSVYHERAPKPKYSSIWDPETIFSYVERLNTLKSLKLKEISEIVVSLLAIATAHRLQTFALINIENIEISSTNLKIKIPSRIKTSKPGKDQPILILPFFNERKRVCVASAILCYLSHRKYSIKCKRIIYLYCSSSPSSHVTNFRTLDKIFNE